MDGFYYDFDLPKGARFSDDDLARIEAEMKAIIVEAQPFVREEHTIAEGLEIFADQPYKREIIEGVEAGVGLDEELAAEAGGNPGAVSTYRNPPGFVDLCRGPHAPSTDRLGHFKLTRVAGAYWRGESTDPQLQRVYGTTWESDKASSPTYTVSRRQSAVTTDDSGAGARPVLVPCRAGLRPGRVPPRGVDSFER